MNIDADTALELLAILKADSQMVEQAQRSERSLEKALLSMDGAQIESARGEVDEIHARWVERNESRDQVLSGAMGQRSSLAPQELLAAVDSCLRERFSEVLDSLKKGLAAWNKIRQRNTAHIQRGLALIGHLNAPFAQAEAATYGPRRSGYKGGLR